MCAPEENDFADIFAQRHETLRRIDELFAQAASLPPEDESAFVALSSSTHDLILRRLFSTEINTLKQNCRSQANDWSRIYLVLSADDSSSSTTVNDQSTALERLISDTRFEGRIILDMTSHEESASAVDTSSNYHRLPPGIHSNLLICDSIFHVESCRVYRNSFLSDTFVGRSAVLVQCGEVVVDNNGGGYGRLSISVGPESGGMRNLQLGSEDTMIDVCRQLQEGPSPLPALPNYQSNMNVIGEGCIVRDTPTLKNVFLHEKATIQSATEVRQSTLYPGACIRGPCTASNVMMQWNSSIIDSSTVNEVMLMEESHIGPNSLVLSSVLGPDVHLSSGEVHTSVVGPNTNAHHQSLLIGILWPLGRGNVGYGANAGSNHTGRLPDQETTAGEGVFWGLSNVIKFPVDLSYSPYSIVAAGTTLPPQRICMPFSLIVTNNHGGNDILPGWVLQSSPYTLVRSERKYATRRKAQRHKYYTGWKIFRPETMAMCRWAKKMLESGEEAPGVGSSILSSRAREVGIRAYTHCLQRYALYGLLQWIRQAPTDDSGKITLNIEAVEKELSAASSLDMRFNADPLSRIEWPVLPWETNENDEWEFQKVLLSELYPTSPSSQWLEKALLELVSLEKDLAQRIHKSKHRDDDRGAKTIPGYSTYHIAANEDSVVVDAFSYAAEIDSVVADVLSYFGWGE